MHRILRFVVFGSFLWTVGWSPVLLAALEDGPAACGDNIDNDDDGDIDCEEQESSRKECGELLAGPILVGAEVERQRVVFDRGWSNSMC